MIKRLLILFFILLATIFSATKLAHSYYWDVSQNAANSLSEDSKSLLANLDAPLHIIIASPDLSIINALDTILQRYQHYSPQIKITHNTHATAETITIEYKELSQKYALDLKNINEQQISALIQQTLNKSENWLAFVTGHGEADPFGNDTLGLSNFSNMIKDAGFHVAQLNLIEQQILPRNINTLVMINPQRNLLPAEQTMLHEYIANGGNLWVFTEPGTQLNELLLAEFGITVAPGIIVDPASLPLGSPHPALKLITDYKEHAINAKINSATVMPWSAHLQINQPAPNWQYQEFLQTNDQAWTYTGPETMDLNLMRQHVGSHGPLNIGLALNNDRQRILILGDSSFITNKYLGMYANKILVNNMLQWLEAKDAAGAYANAAGVDFSYCPSKMDMYIYNYVWIFLVPLMLCGIGFCIRARG